MIPNYSRLGRKLIGLGFVGYSISHLWGDNALFLAIGLYITLECFIDSITERKV